jgi:hypothetical protein
MHYITCLLPFYKLLQDFKAVHYNNGILHNSLKITKTHKSFARTVYVVQQNAVTYL